MNYFPPIALASIIGLTWGWSRWREKRFKSAVQEGARRLNGTYQAGGAFSAGTLHGKVGDRDVVFCFALATSKGEPDLTTVIAVLRRKVPVTLSLKGADAVARVPALKTYDAWLSRLRITAESTQVSARFSGLVRDPDRLVSLAGLVAGLADEIDGGS